MADPVTTLTASTIATLAFQKFIDSAAGELAKKILHRGDRQNGYAAEAHLGQAAGQASGGGGQSDP